MPGDIDAALRALGERLRRAGYTVDALRRVVQVSVPDDVGVLNHAPALERARLDASAAGTLVRLFFLEDDVPLRRVQAALTLPLCEALRVAGGLERRGASVGARLRIDPVGAQYIIADCRFRSAARTAPRRPRAVLGVRGSDPVYPPASDSLLLRDAVVAPGARQVLDLCAGSGVQALSQAMQAQRVVAVDINPRAAGFARLNAALNGVTNITVRVADLYDGVRGEVFDLILANPPFVSSPYASGPSYHAGGPTGDRVLRRVIAGWARHLGPGGRAFAVSHVAVPVRTDLAAMARRWFRGFPGRALVLQVESGTPIDLAAAQALFALDRGLATYAREVRRWVAYLQRHRIRSIAVLLVAAQRTGRAGVEVIDGAARVLPIPLTPPPRQRIEEWLAAGGSPAQA